MSPIFEKSKDCHLLGNRKTEKKMSSSSSNYSEVPQIESIYENPKSSSSEEPPIEEWSSLYLGTPPDSPKMVLYKQGLYDPGSGEICAKYIGLSDSEVFRHPYSSYPRIKDPGIETSLLDPEPQILLNLNGQDLYLDLCEKMGLIPVRGFHKALVEDVINLQYYGVNPVGVRAMCLSLTNNKYVKRLDLSYNQLSEDACYHLGELLGDNFNLKELVLTGCRIGTEGIRRLVVRLSARTMKELDLSKNEFGETGFKYLADQIANGAVIKRLNLSNNDLGEGSAEELAAALERNNTIKCLDLSWNQLFRGSTAFIIELCRSRVLKELNLAWNGLFVGRPISYLLTVPTLTTLDLSNNKLIPRAIKAIAIRLRLAKKLHTLNLSHNPVTPADAFLLLSKLRLKTVGIKVLLLDGVGVSKEFVDERKEILQLDYRTDTSVTYGHVIRNYTLSKPDLRAIVLKRIDFLTSRASKKNQLDIGLYFLRELKTREAPHMMPRELNRAMRQAGFVMDEGLLDEIGNAFPGPRLETGGKTINLQNVADYIKRIWPEKKLPPTPPEPEPEPKRKKKKKRKKYFKIK
ncbi:leucine-rich repeat-containing protein 74B-like [Bombyx mandarina]|uniref:Leucine-rich repeat-containing protein 74B-like n=1 Tax=Bombyx mandarina TaxID=7092 RepID=A0A6J2JAQ2_BOMMA|nr:leucine-rich repeat-containing protein 74B-like [Bombyx mandarina]